MSNALPTDTVAIPRVILTASAPLRAQEPSLLERAGFGTLSTLLGFLVVGGLVLAVWLTPSHLAQPQPVDVPGISTVDQLDTTERELEPTGRAGMRYEVTQP